MGGFVAEAPPLLFRHWHVCGPTRRGNAVSALVAWRCISRSAQDAVRRHKDDAKEEIHLRQGPGPGSSRPVVVIGVSSSRLRVLHTFSLLSLVGWPL
jgi:hypothetical protein